MKFLICTDGSAAAERAVRLGGELAASVKSEVTLFGIVEAAETAPALQERLRASRQWLLEHQVAADIVCRPGEPVAEIMSQTHTAHYDLLVVGAGGNKHQGFLETPAKTYKIIKRILCPVLVVMERVMPPRRILVCTGGKRYIDSAVLLTGQIARAVGASVSLLHVLAPPPAIYARLYQMEADVTRLLHSPSELGRNLSEEKAVLDSLGVANEVRLRQGMVLDEIFAEIRSDDYDLVVTGSAADRGGFRSYMLGDVTREIVKRVHCAVLVARADPGTAPPTGTLRGWLERFTRRQERSAPPPK